MNKLPLNFKFNDKFIRYDFFMRIYIDSLFYKKDNINF